MFRLITPGKGLALSLIVLFASNAQAQKAIEKEFPLKWKTKIGITTYRTNIQFSESQNAVLIGSNGNSREELNDAADGVYMIDPSTGQAQALLQDTKGQDRDVNGIAVDGDRIFFGTDDGIFYCYEKGQLKWSYKVPVENSEAGDIEGTPILAHLDGDDEFDVVFAAENFGLIALQGANGRLKWEYTSRNQDVRGRGLNSPAVCDVNGDGVDDIIWGTRTKNRHKASGALFSSYGDWVLAINGKTGDKFWDFPVYSAVHASPMILKEGGSTKILVAETYSQIHFLDLMGNELSSISNGVPNGGISGLFSSPVMTDNNMLVIGTSWWGDEDGVWAVPTDGSKGTGKPMFHQSGTVSSSAVVADLFKKSPGSEILITTEKGKLVILSANGEKLHTLDLPAGTEATPFVGDIDGDKQMELLIATMDGYLYCYGTKSKVEPVVGQFRFDARNSGHR